MTGMNVPRQLTNARLRVLRRSVGVLVEVGSALLALGARAVVAALFTHAATHLPAGLKALHVEATLL